MWREQIHKLACNHLIQKEMTIDLFQNNPKTLRWTAMDFAEGEGKTEIFVCKFGKEEQVKFYSYISCVFFKTNNSRFQGTKDNSVAT
jgi:hypothetical protein